MGDNLSLEERRFELEKLKTEHDFELRKLELALKQRETGWGAKLFSPLTTTLLAGILTLAASAMGAYITGRNTLSLEREKFDSSSALDKRKQQHELVLKMIGVADPEQGKQNLQFLAESGLITDADLAGKLLASKALPLIPPPASAPASASARVNRPNCSYEFVRAAAPENPEAIQILGTWEQDNIVNIEVPQLAKVTGARTTIAFNKAAADALKAAWLEIEQQGLLDRVISWDGAFVKRTIRGSSTILSNHACGLAFDINVAVHSFGRAPPAAGERGSVRELVPIFAKHGFVWGGDATRPDGGHFEFKAGDDNRVARSDTSGPAAAESPPR
jgi:hypothetical protein